MMPVTAAGGVLFRNREEDTRVLLIFRRGVWDLPKGKREDEESIPECARREVSEEVNCPPPDVAAKLTTTYHEYEENGERLGKTTHWFAMKTDQQTGFEPQKDEGIMKVSWFPLEEAKQKVGYENLKEVLAVFDDWLAKKAK